MRRILLTTVLLCALMSAGSTQPMPPAGPAEIRAFLEHWQQVVQAATAMLAACPQFYKPAFCAVQEADVRLLQQRHAGVCERFGIPAGEVGCPPRTP